MIPAGIEDVYPELDGIFPGDENGSLARERSNPDLRVIDRQSGNVFRTEVKVSAMNPMDYRLSTRVIERLRTHHHESILWTYHIPSTIISVLKIREVDWSKRPVVYFAGEPYYMLGMYFPTDLNPNPLEWNRPEEVFSRLTPELIERRSKTWLETFRQMFVGLQHKDRFNQASIIGV